MKRFSSGKITDILGADTPDREIFQIQNEILDRFILNFFLIAILPVALSMFRIPVTGMTVAHYFHLIDINVLLVLVLAKRKLSYRLKLSFLLGVNYSVAISGFYSFGLFSNATIFLLIGAIVAMTFRNLGFALLSIALSALIMVFFSVLYISGVAKTGYSLEVYQTGVASWYTALAVFLLNSGLVIHVIWEMQRRVKEYLDRIQGMNQELEKRVEERTKELDQVNQDKDRILGVVAHDLNNKLGAVQGALSILLEEEDLEEEEIQKFLTLSLSANSQAIQMLRELLEFSRIHHNEDFSTESIDPSEVIRSSLSFHIPQAREKSIDLVFESDGGKSIVRVNRLYFSRVIDNLITNAIKFSQPGSSVEVIVDRDHSDFLTIRVRDQGIGIPEELTDKIFIPFSGTGRPGTGGEASNGLGLFIARQIVEKHDGEIWFESEAGRGTTFFVRLPVIQF